MKLSRSVNSIDELPRLADEFKQKFSQKIILLEGEMGAGKTSFIKALCASMGVEDEVSSPTYSVVNEYRTKDNEPVFHFDCYRLESEEEALDFGIEEYLDSGSFCFIEWAEKISNLLASDYNTIKITGEGTAREFELTY